MKSVIAIIPARGGSKGIPGKNLKLVGGRSLLRRSIDAALASKSVSRVIVSTDSDEIADEGRASGGEVFLRPAHLATDTSTSEDAILHVINALKDTDARMPNIVAFIQCTSPFLNLEDIDNVIQPVAKGICESAFAVTRFDHFVWGVNEDGTWKGINHDERVRLRRQDRVQQYREAGSVYAFKTERFLAERFRFCGRSVGVEVPFERSFEIDTFDDLKHARALAHSLDDSLRFSAAKGIVFDFDGVFTDNRVFISEKGEESVVCSRSDGMGIEQLRERGVPMAVISKEVNPVTQMRCRKLGIECYSAVDKKLPVLKKWLEKREIDPRFCVYLGNDVNDVECFDYVGFPVAVADAHESVKPYVSHFLSQKGGYGAVRELCDILCRSR